MRTIELPPDHLILMESADYRQAETAAPTDPPISGSYFPNHLAMVLAETDSGL